MANEAKPTKLKKLEGTYRKDRVARNEMEVSECEVMPAPASYFNEKAKDIWYKCTEELSNLKMLHKVDMELLSAYCHCMGLYEQFAKELLVEGYTVTMTNKGGFSYEVKNPKFTMMNESLDRANKIAVQFGWTPASRTKISAQAGSDEGDEFEKLNRKYK